MPAKAKKTTNRKNTRKSTRSSSKPKQEMVELSEEVSLAMLLGVASVLLGVGAMIGNNSYIAVLAILAGSLAVWWSMRLKHYHHTFMAMVGLMMAMTAIWAISMTTEMDIISLL